MKAFINLTITFCLSVPQQVRKMINIVKNRVYMEKKSGNKYVWKNELQYKNICT